MTRSIIAHIVINSHVMISVTRWRLRLRFFMLFLLSCFRGRKSRESITRECNLQQYVAIHGLSFTGWRVRSASYVGCRHVYVGCVMMKVKEERERYSYVEYIATKNDYMYEYVHTLHKIKRISLATVNPVSLPKFQLQIQSPFINLVVKKKK